LEPRLDNDNKEDLFSICSNLIAIQSKSFSSIQNVVDSSKVLSVTFIIFQSMVFALFSRSSFELLLEYTTSSFIVPSLEVQLLSYPVASMDVLQLKNHL
jgi:hypothetical protein